MISGFTVNVPELTQKLQGILHAGNVKGILVRQWSRKKRCDKVEAMRKFTYLGDRVSVVGGCEAAVTGRTRCGWVKFRECNELLYGRRFPLKLKGAVYESYVRPSVLYGCESCCLRESEIGIL